MLRPDRRIWQEWRWDMFGWKRKRIGKIEAKEGASLIIVICVSAFLAAFALAMVYTAGLLLSNASRRLERERCYQLAKSFSQTLDGELFRYTSLDGADPDSFYRFACRFLEYDGYMDYNPSYPETAYHYKAESPAGAQDYGEIEIILYKESDLGGDGLTGIIEYNWDQDQTLAKDPMEEITGQLISRYTFTVEVIVERDGMRYSYSTVYDPSVTYREDAVVCRNPEGARISWDKTTQKWMTDSTTEYRPAGGTALITYEIQPGLEKLDTCTFKKSIREIGDPDESGAEGGGP